MFFGNFQTTDAICKTRKDLYTISLCKWDMINMVTTKYINDLLSMKRSNIYFLVAAERGALAFWAFLLVSETVRLYWVVLGGFLSSLLKLCELCTGFLQYTQSALSNIIHHHITATTSISNLSFNTKLLDTIAICIIINSFYAFFFSYAIPS